MTDYISYRSAQKSKVSFDIMLVNVLIVSLLKQAEAILGKKISHDNFVLCS